MSLNDVGIEILNNKSYVIENLIEKSHENGIKIIGDHKDTRCMPHIWKNRVTSSGQNGLYAHGEQCEPDIRGNVIDSNRKAGIKFCEMACGHIGGTSKEDLGMFIKQSPLPQVNPSLTEKVADTIGGSTSTMKAGAKKNQPIGLVGPYIPPDLRELSPHIPKYNVKSFYNTNTISHNFNQGILLVEGSYATIIANKIEKNIKANVAFGGLGCGKTRVLYNLIDASKQEGVFVIEGEDGVMIEENEIVGNHDGIVLVESKGLIKGNVIKEN